MAISRETQDHLARGDFTAIEDAWLARSASAPGDLDYFVGVARALVGGGQEERARLLLELLDEQLRGRGEWRERLQLLRRVGAILFPAPLDQHREILSSLRGRHGASPSFAGLAETVGLHRAPDDVAKTWEKIERLESLLAFDLGAIVWMEGKGAGRVVEVNLGLESFKIDFPRHAGLTVGFRAAPKLLKPLPPGHVLRRRLDDPAALARLRDEDPPELLRAVLESHDRPLTAAEVREALDGVVDEQGWAVWWAAARRHPQVVTSGGGRQTYAWAGSSDAAADQVWRAFDAADLPGKLDLLRRAASRDPELRRRMAAELAAAGEQAAGDQPGVAFEIWAALERAGEAPPPDAAWSATALAASADPRALVTGIGDRLLRERALGMLREQRADWAETFADLLSREAEPRVLDALAAPLRAAAPQALDRFVDQVLAQPRRAPAAFVWLAERAADDADLQGRQPLRLVQQILAAVSAPEFAPHRPRLKPLAEAGGTLPRLLSRLDAAQAPAAAEAITRAPGLEAHQRGPLLNALHLRFPALAPPVEAPLYATPEAIAARRQELQRLVETEIPANRKAIAEARAHGDLRENFEYKAARQRHEYLASRAATLDADLRRVRPLDAARLDATEVRVGTRVHLRAADGGLRVVTILGPWESRPEEDVLSYESDLAKVLLGKRVGDTVEVEARAATIERLEPYR